MKKIFGIFAALVLGGAAAQAQYMCSDAGAVFIYKGTAEVDGKQETTTSKVSVDSIWTAADGLVSARMLTVQSVPGNDLAEVRTYSFYTFNPADNLTVYKMMTADEYKRMMVEMIAEQARSAGQAVSDADLKKLANAIRVKGELNLDLPENPDPAAKVPNQSIKINFQTMSLSMNLWEVKYLGKESLTVPAGTFDDCVKVSYVIKVNTPAGVEKNYCTSWFAKGIGEVKTIQADKKGKVQSESVLDSIKK